MSDLRVRVYKFFTQDSSHTDPKKLKSLYRDMAKKYHPDKYSTEGGKKKANEIFLVIQSTYERLSIGDFSPPTKGFQPNTYKSRSNNNVSEMDIIKRYTAPSVILKRAYWRDKNTLILDLEIYSVLDMSITHPLRVFRYMGKVVRNINMLPDNWTSWEVSVPKSSWKEFNKTVKVYYYYWVENEYEEGIKQGVKEFKIGGRKSKFRKLTEEYMSKFINLFKSN